MSRQIVPFGAAQDGRPVEKILLRRGRLEAEVMTLGAAVLSLRVPDREGRLVDVVLGWSCPAAYEENGGYLGMLVGRYANRIAGSRCVIDGQEFRLTANEGTKQLHGGPKGFGFQLFQPEIVDESTVRFHHTAPDGENGFPGTLRLTATYTLTEEGLRLHYQAETDKPTLCNLTNHSYFNLNGGGSVLNHRLWVDAEHYTPVDADSIPTALSAPAAHTPFDFTAEKPIGRDIGADCQQLRLTSGYDHNLILRPQPSLRLAARLTGEKSGIVMETYTDQPGLQLYTANFLSDDPRTKTGVPYKKRDAVCLETQLPPDSPNHPEWGDIILRPGDIYERTTEYRFL